VDFLRALGFLTILPSPRLESTPEDLGRSSGWFPFAGALLGSLLAAAHAGLALLLPATAAAAFSAVLWAFLTRGLHLDGLADTFDGIGGGYGRESRLAIMKDSRLGAFGGIAVASALVLKTSLLAGAGRTEGLQALFLAPVLGRWAILFAMRLFPSARPGGMGDLFRKGCTNRCLLLGTVVTVLFATAAGGMTGLLLLALVPLFTLLFSRWLASLLGGLTGDSYGAVCELSEILSLCLFAALR
jgi:adenosylcobinamide-GDP ribazoletransferase